MLFLKTKQLRREMHSNNVWILVLVCGIDIIYITLEWVGAPHRYLIMF